MKHCTVVKSMYCNYTYRHGFILKTLWDQKRKCKLQKVMYNRAPFT